ncbi:MAG: hypothetical protein KBC78_03105 [Candidatus Pacebacteria bacterium]|nr:hypothetical protein [Candidatus Paceibacterota bacterium]
MKKYKYLNHSGAYANKIQSFFEVSFQMIEELISSHTVNSQYGQFSQKNALEFLAKQKKLKAKIQVEKNYCLGLIVSEINSVFGPSITRLNILNEMIQQFPASKNILQSKIREEKLRHLKLTEELNSSEQGLSAEVSKRFTALEAKFANQTERIKLTFGLN